jgi:hypothetical protein
MLIGELVDFFYRVLYRFFSCICIIIDFIKRIFCKLCGIDTVTINGEDGDLLSSLMGSKDVETAFLIVLIIGVILLVVFTIIAVVKTSYVEKMTVGNVMKKTLESLIIMVLIPFTCIAGIVLTNVIMGAINQAMTANLAGGQSTIGGMFLMTIGTDAFTGEAGMQELIETQFISGELDYANLKTVRNYYDIQSLNYVIGILGSLVMLIMFVLSSITFVQRIFDIVLLYIISPISIATIPLDEGNRFKRWKEMFIGKMLSAYGVVLVMNLFFLIIPQVYQIDFFHNKFENGIVYILFLIGGCFAVTKASQVIASLTGGEQGGHEMASMIYNVRSAFALAKGTKAMMKNGLGKLVGGSDYNRSRKKGKTRGESLQSALHSDRNRRTIDPNKKFNHAKHALAKPLRMATMPVGMLHDLARGGVIQMGRNFMPRLNNLKHGDTLFNRADVEKPLKPKAEKPKPKGGSGGDKEEKPNQQNNEPKPTETPPPPPREDKPTLGHTNDDEDEEKGEEE